VAAVVFAIGSGPGLSGDEALELAELLGHRRSLDVPPDDGSVDVQRWYQEEGARQGATILSALHETELTTTRCVCGASYEGTFADGRAWFAQHRREAHSSEGV